jgi:hypothetical protein
MAESRSYRVGRLTVAEVGREVERFLRDQGLVVEGYDGPGGYLVQAKQDQTGWRKYAKFAGLDKAVQVQLLPGADGLLTVSVGQGKWLDKLGAGAVGALWFFPLALTSGIGAVSQLKLVGDIYRAIETFLIRGGV